MCISWNKIDLVAICKLIAESTCYPRKKKQTPVTPVIHKIILAMYSSILLV